MGLLFKSLIEQQLLSNSSNNQDNSVLVIDTNLGLEHALGIARTSNNKYKVYYAIDNHEPYPRAENEISGLGFNEITKIQDFGQVLDKVKYIIFTDSGYGYLAKWLRDNGYYVFGADPKSERLELDRVYVRKILTNLGIDIPPGFVVKGIDGVINAIKQAKKEGKKVFIKISKYRGSVETFGTDDPEEAEFLLSQGGFKIYGDNVQFVVEYELNGIEIGIDTWFNGNQFIPIVADTIEMKGTGNATKFNKIENSIWYPVLKKLEPFLAKNGYYGMFCMEGFYDGNKLYVTDITPRFPYICSYAYPKVINNYADFILGVSRGDLIIPDIKNKYSVQIGVYTDSDDKWKKIDFDMKYYPNKIAFRRVIKKKDNQFWFVPGDPVVAVGIGYSNNLNDAIQQSIDVTKSVSAPEIYSSGYDFYAYLKELLQKAKYYGYNF